MLDIFRRGGVAQLIVGAIAVTIIIVFALEFRPGRGAVARLTEDCAVQVEDGCVSQKEFLAAYGLIVPYGASPKLVKQLDVRRHVVGGLIERELLVAEAQRLGIGISTTAVDDELAAGRFHVSLPVNQRTLSRQLILCKVEQMSDQCEPGSEMLRYVPDVKSVETGEFDYKKYERIVRNVANRGPREFKEMQERELLAERMRNLVRARVRVSIEEARMQFDRERSKATVRTVTANRDWFARYVVSLGSDEVTAWDQKNKAAVDAAWAAEKPSFTADCPLVSEITLVSSPDAAEAEQAEQRAKLEQAEKRLREGTPFESVARAVSQAPSAVNGGYLGCLTEAYGAGAAELLQAVGKLEAGKVTPIVQSSSGLTLLKFHGKLKKEEIDKVGRRAVAERLALRARAEELAKDFSTRLIERAKGGAKLEQAVPELSQEFLKQHAAQRAGGSQEAALADDTRPNLEISAPFGITSSPIPDALPGEPVASHAFALEKPDAVHPAPIATERGFAVLQLKEKELSKPEQFEKEKHEIVRSLEHAKATDALVRYLAQLRKTYGDKVRHDKRLLEDTSAKDQPGDS
ncbi:MAG TPA: SurA N-terminal domain-containing protein [Polyangiaceae bacterium]|nr:SurA N-terminal domain-containing protein [Polyangiaceae bacterium]